MLTKMKKHSDLLPIAASGVPTKDIPALYNHHALLLNCKSSGGTALTQAQIETDISYVEVALTMRSGKTIKLIDNLTPAEIFDLLNDYYDNAKATYTNAGVLRIPYTRPHLYSDFRALSIGMLDVKQYLVKLTLSASLATLATCELVAVYDTEPTRPLGEHLRITPKTYPNQSTGEQLIDDLPHGEAGTAMLGYHIEYGSTPGVISQVRVEVDGEDYYNPLDAALNNLQLRNARRTPNSDYFHVPLDKEGLTLGVGRARSFLNYPTWTTAPGSSFRVIPEVVYGLGDNNAI